MLPRAEWKLSNEHFLLVNFPLADLPPNLTDLDAIVERLQPYFVPVRPISCLRTSSTVLSGFTSRT